METAEAKLGGGLSALGNVGGCSGLQRSTLALLSSSAGWELGSGDRQIGG